MGMITRAYFGFDGDHVGHAEYWLMALGNIWVYLAQMLHQQTAQLSCMKLLHEYCLLVKVLKMCSLSLFFYYYYVSLCSLGNVLKHLLERCKKNLYFCLLANFFFNCLKNKHLYFVIFVLKPKNSNEIRIISFLHFFLYCKTCYFNILLIL